MKTTLLALLLALTGLELLAQPVPSVPAPGQRRLPRYIQPAPSLAVPAGANANAQPEETVPPGYIDFQGVDVTQVLDVYAKLVNRTILRGAGLPEGKIILKTQTVLTKTEAIEALKAVLAMNNVSVIDIGDKFVKALPSDQANTAGAEFNTNNAAQLPELGSYVTRIVQLRYVKPSEMMQVITPFAKLPNSVIAIDSNGILVIRDYAENVKRMMEMIEQIDIAIPTEYISEVIPIRYAKVDDIASALNSLGGGGGATVSIGSAPSNTKISGLAGTSTSGFGGMNSGVGGGGVGGGGLQSGGIGGGGIARPYSSTTTANPNGTPSSNTSFTQRLNNIINRAGSGGGGGGNGQDQIQLFGQTKIIPDESSSSLLIFATRQDMDMIKEIIAKLDVPLAQVLIEAVIMDVSLGKTFNLGVSAAQNPINKGGSVFGGGVNNGQPFLNFLQNAVSSVTNTTGSEATSNLMTTIVNTITQQASSVGTNGSFANSLPGGMSYFGNLGPTWDIAVNAAESDSTANIIQRPRIQTSQAIPAQFFVGETVPYVTSTYNGGGVYGNSSSYSQLSVGVELDVTPFINPEGEVTMQIQQEIDDLDGYTAITGVGNVPNTIKRTLNTTITVRDKDTVMLGGFVKTDKSNSKSGVPFLSDIPLLGALFTQRNDQKDREELIVLMRPTVLKTPELAAQNTVKEAQRLPGVSAAAAESEDDERKLVDAERKREMKSSANGVNTNGFFNMIMPSDDVTNAIPTNAVPPDTSAAPAGMPEMDNQGAPPDAAAAQQKAMDAFQKNSAAVDAPKITPAISPAQKAKLDVLLNAYMAGKISEDEYKTDRDKIMSEPSR